MDEDFHVAPSDAAEGRIGVREFENISWSLEKYAEGRRYLKHKGPYGYWPWTWVA